MADLYIDNDVPLRLGHNLQSMGHNVVTAYSLGTRRATDDHHLLAAAQQRRILITHNAKDFKLLHDAWLRWSTAWGVAEQHAGIFVIPQRTAIPVLELEILAQLSSGLLMANVLYSFDEKRGWMRRP